MLNYRLCMLCVCLLRVCVAMVLCCTEMLVRTAFRSVVLMYRVKLCCCVCVDMVLAAY